MSLSATTSSWISQQLQQLDDSLIDRRSPAYKWWLLASIMLSTSMVVLDATIVNIALPTIMADFGVDISQIQWSVTAYMLAMASLLPTSAWLAERYGYKRMFLLGLLLFTLGSWLCGRADSEGMLVAARVIEGMGGGVLQALGLAIVTREFPPEQRGIAMGFWSIASAASLSFGPVLGGVLIDNFSWPLIFDVNVPLGALAMAAAVVVQYERKADSTPPFDFIGFLSITIALPLLLFALSQGTAVSNAEGWHAPYLWVCFGVSGLCFAIFIVQELTTAHPLIDLRLFGIRNFGMACIMIFLFLLTAYSTIYLMPLYMQESLNYSPTLAGMVFLPVGIVQAIAGPLSGAAADRINAKFIMAAGILIMAVNFYYNAQLSFLTSFHYLIMLMIGRGIGMGMIFSPLSAVAFRDVPAEKMGHASGLFSTLRQLGGSVAVALYTTVLNSRETFHNQVYGEALRADSPAYQQTTLALVETVAQRRGTDLLQSEQLAEVVLLKQLKIEAAIQAMNDDLLLACGLTLLSLVPMLLMRLGKKSQNASSPPPTE